MERPIIILGGNGMLGQDLAEVFKESSPLIWDREDLDITDKDVVQATIQEHQPQLVINAAAYNFVDDAEEEKGFEAALKVNADGPKYLAQACKDNDAVFVHYSTDYVFDGKSIEGYEEYDEPSPKSNYAISKLQGEEHVTAFMLEARMYVIRTCRLFGNAGSGEDTKQSFVDLMLSLAKKKDSLDVVDEEVASPTYSMDLAQQTKLLLSEHQYPSGIYHMTNSGSCTWYEFAKEIFAQAGNDIPVNPVTADAFPRPAHRPAYSVLLNTKLPPMRSWQDALRAYLQSKDLLVKK